MRKLILRNRMSVGDIVMLTAAVRDLHASYPGLFVTDIRTTCRELWENNPYLTPLDEYDPEVEILDCHYPLIDWANRAPYHTLHGFVEFLNAALGLAIRPVAFKGDIHLSPEEQSWETPMEELTGRPFPYWLVSAGGKYDLTIKWWASERYQAVIDHFRDRIQFVQIGAWGDYHPRLEGAIDLRGRTTLRQLVRLVHHAQGVLCGVTGLMHLAAAVPEKGRLSRGRPCVVVAGGREPPHWEAYPQHQFLHTIGALPCCATGGCWKTRTRPLGDGSSLDRKKNLCVDVRGDMPHCMDLITPEEVIRRIELYFQDRSRRYLKPSQARQAALAVTTASNNGFRSDRLTLTTARAAEETRIRNLEAYPGTFGGRGIVMCAGGLDLLTNAWVHLRMLRDLGCRLPVQVWHVGEAELDAGMRSLLAPLQVECVDACAVRRRHPVRLLQGWSLKPYAILHCPFREVLLLDADNMPVRDPEYLFTAPAYRETGAVFWPDQGRLEAAHPIWEICGIPFRDEPEFESGQVLVDKSRCWPALLLTMWYNEHADFFYRHIYGDKETFHLAFRKLNQPFSMPNHPQVRLPGMVCQQDFHGHRLFQHRTTAKWSLHHPPPPVKGAWYEKQTRQFHRRLAASWDGRMNHLRSQLQSRPALYPAGHRLRRPVRIEVWITTCAERDRILKRTLRHWRATDWGEEPPQIQWDARRFGNPSECNAHTVYQAITRALAGSADYFLLLEDDVRFNRFLRHNLETWEPLQTGEITLATLYNPGIRALACDIARNALAVDPESVFGSQAFLISRELGEYLIAHWHEDRRPRDHRMAGLAARLSTPLYAHIPSLVQHTGRRSICKNRFHVAVDFDPDWRATSRYAASAGTPMTAVVDRAAVLAGTSGL